VACQHQAAIQVVIRGPAGRHLLRSRCPFAPERTLMGGRAGRQTVGLTSSARTRRSAAFRPTRRRATRARHASEFRPNLEAESVRPRRRLRRRSSGLRHRTMGSGGAAAELTVGSAAAPAMASELRVRSRPRMTLDGTRLGP
jgi:hypothetical protein